MKINTMINQRYSPDNDTDRVFKAISLSETSYNADLLRKMLDWVSKETDSEKRKYITRLVTYSQSAFITEIVRLMANCQQWQIAGVVLGERFVSEEDPDDVYVLEKESPSKVIEQPKYEEQGCESDLFKYEYIADKFSSPASPFNGAMLYPIGPNQYVKVLYKWSD